MSQRVGNPFAPFLDRRGLPLTGSLYLGTEGDDPEVSDVTAYFDAALTLVAPQPIVIVGGFPRNAGNPTLIYVAEDTFSMRTRDEDGGEVFYVANAAIDSDQFQPLDTDLTSIAALSTTAYGRALLTLANAAAGRTYLGSAGSGANADITSLLQSTAVAPTGTAAADSIGYRGLPPNAQAGAYTLVLADAGRLITTTADVAIPANGTVAFPVGTAFTVFNTSASPIDITITSDSLYLATSGTPGPLILAAYGLATFVKVNATSWVGSGAGLS